MNLFVFGLGYSALHFVLRFHQRFERVVGTVTSAERRGPLADKGIEGIVFDGSAPSRAVAERLRESDALLVSVPPDAGGDPALVCHGADIAAAPRLSWIGYLSTVGVYGDADGGWVDEATEPRPRNWRSKERLAAERAWLDLGRRSGKPVHVFRLAGIYGPQRNALAQLASGTAKRIVKPGQVFNRIHVDDIAAVLMASIARPNAGAIYNLADDEPAPPQDVVAYAAHLAGVEPPPELPFEDVRLPPMAASFYGECKRVANRRIKEELGVILRFPTYREGLAALRAAGEGPVADQAAWRSAVGPKNSM